MAKIIDRVIDEFQRVVLTYIPGIQRKIDEDSGLFHTYAIALLLAEQYNALADVTEVSEARDLMQGFIDKYNNQVYRRQQKYPTTLKPVERDSKGKYIIPEELGLPPRLEKLVQKMRADRYCSGDLSIDSPEFL